MHDAKTTMVFNFTNSIVKKMALATDIGYIDNGVKEHFKGVDIMVIECNYDYSMLMTCSYPWDLKNRVKSNNGHLSNEESAKFICENYHDNLKKVYLAHVSKDSNRYELAFAAVKNQLKAEGIEVELEIAYQDKVTEIFSI